MCEEIKISRQPARVEKVQVPFHSTRKINGPPFLFSQATEIKISSQTTEIKISRQPARVEEVQVPFHSTRKII